MLCLDQKYGNCPTTITHKIDGSKIRIYAVSQSKKYDHVWISLEGSLKEWDIPYKNKTAKLFLGLHPLVITHIGSNKKVTIWLTKILDFSVRIGYGAERGVFNIDRHNFGKKVAGKEADQYNNHRDEINEFIE